MSRRFLQFFRSDNTCNSPSKTYHACSAWYASYFQEMGVTLEQMDWPKTETTQAVLHFLKTTNPSVEQRYAVFPAAGPDQQRLSGAETDLNSHVLNSLHGYHLHAITCLAGYYMQTLPTNDTSIALNCSLGSSSPHGEQGEPHGMADIVISLLPADNQSTFPRGSLKGLKGPIPLVVGKGKWDIILEAGLKYLIEESAVEPLDLKGLRPTIQVGEELKGSPSVPAHVAYDISCQVGILYSLLILFWQVR